MKSARKYMLAFWLPFYVVGCGSMNDSTMKFSTIRLEENFPDSEATQDLVKASCSGSQESVSTAIEKGAKVNDPGSRNIPPIFWAVVNNCTEGIGLLVKAGASVNQKMEGGASAVWLAAGESTNTTLLVLLDSGGDPNHVTRDSSPLLEAAGSGRWDNVHLLIAHGADVNWMAKSGSTVATFAIARGQFSELLSLLESGYRTNLESVASTSKNRILPKDSEQNRYRQIVLEKLAGQQ